MHNERPFTSSGPLMFHHEETPPKSAFSRAHKKSRKGCKICKERKVKCDETRPACRNCTRRCPQLKSCDYPTGSYSTATKPPALAPRFVSVDFNTGFPSNGTTSSSPPSINSIDIHPPGIPSTSAHRRLELRLLHHFTTITSRSLPTTGPSDTHHLWTTTVPQLVFASDLVLEGLMAFSALHLRTLCPSDTDLAAAEARYIAKTYARQREAVSLLGEARRSPGEVFTAALFIFHYSWLTENRAAVEETPYKLPTKIYHLARASKELFFSLPEMHMGHLDLYCPRIDLVKAARPHPSHFIESGLLDVKRLIEALEGHEVDVETDRAVLREALQTVENIVNIFTGEDAFPVAQNVLALMPLRTSHRFVWLLEAHDPFAMAVLARNFALIHAVERVWWMHGAEGMELARGNVRGIRGLMPEGHEWMIEWPVDVVEGRIFFDL